MTLNTKFNMRDTVMFMHDNRVIEGEIKTIKWHLMEDDFRVGRLPGFVLYTMRHKSGQEYERWETQCFKTKEELLASL